MAELACEPVGLYGETDDEHEAAPRQWGVRRAWRDVDTRRPIGGTYRERHFAEAFADRLIAKGYAVAEVVDVCAFCGEEVCRMRTAAERAAGPCPDCGSDHAAHFGAADNQWEPCPRALARHEARKR